MAWDEIAGIHHPGLASLTALLCTTRSQALGAQNQADVLREEGVRVTANAMGELMVDFDEFGWFPSHLPSEP